MDQGSPVASGCAEAAPDWVQPGSVCIKPLAAGMDIHAGGHTWCLPALADTVSRAHFDDPAALLAGGTSSHHMPEDCHPGCHSYQETIKGC